MLPAPPERVSPTERYRKDWAAMQETARPSRLRRGLTRIVRRTPIEFIVSGARRGSRGRVRDAERPPHRWGQPNGLARGGGRVAGSALGALLLARDLALRGVLARWPRSGWTAFR